MRAEGSEGGGGIELAEGNETAEREKEKAAARFNQFITSDNAMNMVRAMELMPNTTRVPCVAHVTHLAVTAAMAITGVDKHVGSVRSIVHHFSKSPGDVAILKKELASNGKKPKKLIMDSKTRWNSTLKMIERFRELYPTLKSLASKQLLDDTIATTITSLNDASLSTSLQNIMDLLLPLKEITE